MAGLVTEENSSFISGTVIQGHQIASGKTLNSPYPDGSIPLQTPFFRELGLDLTAFYPGTLNVSIAPQSFRLRKASYRFDYLQWIEGFAPETFSFCACAIWYKDTAYDGYIYYPHPETKTQHFHNDSLLEVICKQVHGIEYGDSVRLQYLTEQIDII